MLKLAIGNKAYSSWSLRPWIALRALDIPFEEVVIPLDQSDSSARIGAVSPGSRVPALHDGDLVIWESLAILEYLAEQYPQLWPADRAARAVARSVANEMHAGFTDLRRHYPMNVRASKPQRERGAEKDVARIVEIWTDARTRFGAGGPFLFGAFSNADAMFAPVASRFRTYAVATDDPVASAYVETIMSMPAMRDWVDGAAAEPWFLDKYESI